MYIAVIRSDIKPRAQTRRSYIAVARIHIDLCCLGNSNCQVQTPAVVAFGFHEHRIAAHGNVRLLGVENLLRFSIRIRKSDFMRTHFDVGSVTSCHAHIAARILYLY